LKKISSTPSFHDKKYISSSLFLMIGFMLVILVIVSPSTSMTRAGTGADYDYSLIQNVLADSSNEDQNQNPTPVNQDSTMEEKTAIEDTENGTNMTDEKPIIDCTQNNEKLCRNDKGSKQEVIEETEENTDNADQSSTSNQTETLPTIDTSNTPKNSTKGKLRTPSDIPNIRVFVAGDFPHEGSFADCLARAFGASNAKQEAEDCASNMKTDQVPQPPGTGHAGLDNINSILAAGSRTGTGDTSMCAEKEDPRGSNPYAEDKGGAGGGPSGAEGGSGNSPEPEKPPKGVVKVTDKDTGKVMYVKGAADEGIYGTVVVTDEKGRTIFDEKGRATWYTAQDDGTWKETTGISSHANDYVTFEKGENGEYYRVTQLYPLKKPGNQFNRPVNGDQDNQEICKNFVELLNSCKDKRITNGECVRITKGCAGFDPTIALTTGEDSCKEDKIDPSKVKRIAMMICMQDKKPVPGEEACTPKVTGDPCKSADDKTVTTPSIPDTGNSKGLGSCISAQKFDPCNSPIALREESCPVTEITLPFSDLGQPGVCVPDVITGIPKLCTSTSPSSSPPQPKGPQPEPTPKFEGTDLGLGDISMNPHEIDPPTGIDAPPGDQQGGTESEYDRPPESPN
jgi:hypothetical protein